MPALHALIIGVGNYPNRSDLSQPGPVMSAARFAEWLKGEYCHPSYTLGSLFVLLSPVDANQASDAHQVAGQLDGPATHRSVEKFVVEWAAACDRNPQDAALLYVAGHGCSMLPGAGYLLLEEFGLPGSLLADALNLSALIDAMGTKKAHTNFVFVDACRSPFDQIEGGGMRGVTPLDVPVNAPRLRKVLKLFYGAAPEDRAWTLPADQTFEHGTIFSKALLRALRRDALELDDDGQLAVTANRLVQKTAMLVGNTAALLRADEYQRSITQAPEGVGSIADIAFHVPQAVNVDLKIEIDPEDLAAAVQASLYKLNRPDEIKYDRDLSFVPHPAHLEVASGKYQLNVYRPPFHTVRNRVVIPDDPHWRFEIDTVNKTNKINQ
jgi:hypothetical protein